ncbi:MAG: DnaD domain protein, partial [Ktedonobacteraceae bacterium]
AAFSEAVQRNKRNWKYISAILRRWETEGRSAWNA